MNTKENLRLYFNPRCGTARAVLAALRDAGYAPELIEYLKTPPALSTLQTLVRKTGASALAIVRTKEALFQALGLDAEGVSGTQLLQAIVEHPVLLNRPICEADDFAQVVRPSATVTQFITRLQA